MAVTSTASSTKPAPSTSGERRGWDDSCCSARNGCAGETAGPFGAAGGAWGTGQSRKLGGGGTGTRPGCPSPGVAEPVAIVLSGAFVAAFALHVGQTNCSSDDE